MNKHSFESEIARTVVSSGGKDILFEGGELAFDQAIKQDLLKDIPVIGTIANLIKVGIGIRGYLFIKKLQSFLNGMSNISDKERSDFSERLDADEAFRNKVGEHLLLILDKLDDMEKAKLVARAFMGLVREEYDFHTFQRLSVAIDRCMLVDLEWLRLFNRGTKIESFVALSLSSVGLIEIHAIPSVRDPDTPNDYLITPFGSLMLAVVIEGGHREDSDF